MEIFNNNIALLEKTDKAICCFREQRHDIALGILADSMELIRHSIEAVITSKYLTAEVDSVNNDAVTRGLQDEVKCPCDA